MKSCLMRGTICSAVVIFFIHAIAYAAGGTIGIYDDHWNSLQEASNYLKQYYTSGLWIAGNLIDGQDHDWLKFKIDKAPKLYLLELKTVDSLTPIRVEVTDQNGTVQHTVDVSSSNSILMAGEDDEETLFLHIYSPENEKGNYFFKITPLFSIYPLISYIAQNDNSNLYDTWSEKKSLMYLSGPIPGTDIGVTVFIDLADYAGLTEEGQNGWVTLWGNFDLSFGISVSPINAGYITVDFINDYDITGATCLSLTTPILQATLIDGSNSGYSDYSYYLGQPTTTDFSFSFLSTSFTFEKVEIRRELLDEYVFSNSNFMFPVSQPITTIINNLIQDVFNNDGSLREIFNARMATESDFDIGLTGPAIEVQETNVTYSDYVINFDDVLIGETESISINIINYGDESLIVSEWTSDLPVFQLSPTNLAGNSDDEIIPAKSQKTVDIIFSPISTSEYQAYIKIVSNDPRRNPFYLTVLGKGKTVAVQDLEVVLDVTPASVEPNGALTLSGSVTSDGSTAVSGASVSSYIGSTYLGSDTTGSDGSYTINATAPSNAGPYTVELTVQGDNSTGFAEASLSVVDNSSNHDVALTNFTCSSSFIQPGNSISLSAKLINIAKISPGEYVSVTYKIIGPDGTPDQYTDPNTHWVPDDDTQVPVSHVFTPSGATGTWSASITATPNNGDADLSNNICGGSFQVEPKVDYYRYKIHDIAGAEGGFSNTYAGHNILLESIEGDDSARFSIDGDREWLEAGDIYITDDGKVLIKVILVIYNSYMQIFEASFEVWEAYSGSEFNAPITQMAGAPNDNVSFYASASDKPRNIDVSLVFKDDSQLTNSSTWPMDDWGLDDEGGGLYLFEEDIRNNTAPGEYIVWIDFNVGSLRMAQKVEVTVLPTHDVSVSSINTGSGSYTVNQSVPISASVNVSNGFTEQVVLTLSIAGPNNFTYSQTKNQSITGSSTITFSNWNTTGLEAGSYVVSVKATIANDSNSGNNASSTSVTLNPLPALTVTADFTKTSYADREPVKLYSSVSSSQGTVSSAQVMATVTCPDASQTQYAMVYNALTENYSAIFMPTLVGSYSAEIKTYLQGYSQSIVQCGPVSVLSTNVPEIQIVSPTTNIELFLEDSLQLQFVGSDNDSDATISVYLDTDTNPLNGKYPVPDGIGLAETISSLTMQASDFPVGTYFIYIVIFDEYSSSSVYSQTTITINQAVSEITTIQITPSSVSIETTGQQQFTAVGYDQFGAQMNGLSFDWSTNGGGSIDNDTGLFTAGSNAGGPYIISAENDGVVGAAQLYIVQYTLPEAPSFLTAYASNGNVDLTWTEPDNDGGSSITGYKIYRGTSAGDETLLASTNDATTSYTDSSVTNGTEYFYKVSAVNSVGEGPLSNEASATPQNLSPTAVHGGPYTGVVDTAITLDGSGSYDNDGSIALYEWEFGDGDSISTLNATQDHTYDNDGTFAVRLRVQDNDGAWSDWVETSAVVSPVPIGSASGWIAYSSNINGNRDIFVQKPDGSALQQITDSPYDEDPCDFSPDNTQLIYAIPSEAQLWIYDWKTGTKTKLYDSIDYHGQDYGIYHQVGYAQYSPDGTKIAFTERYANSDWNITLLNIDGSGRYPLPIDNTNENSPTWAPDGKKLAYIQNGDVWIWDFSATGNVADGNAIQLTDGLTALTPTWKISNQILLEYGGKIALVNSDTGDVSYITSPTGRDSYPRWSPDMNYIMHANNSNDWHLFIRTYSSGDTTPFTNSATSQEEASAWGNPVGDPATIDPTMVSKWELLPGQLNAARHAGGGGALLGKIYYCGGGTPDGSYPYAVDTVEVYDPSTGLWSYAPSMPTNRHSVSTAVLDDYLYVIGGHTANSRKEVERYNPSTGWQSMTSMNYERNHPGVATYNGKIYVFGGHRFGSDLSSIEIYDPTTNSWTMAGNMPETRQPVNAVPLGDKIYIGLKGDDGKLWEYDPATSAWNTDLPVPLADHQSVGALVLVEDRIYAIGGYQLGACHGIVESWAPGESSWRLEPALNVPRGSMGAAVIDNIIYVFGGWSGSENLASTEQLEIKTIIQWPTSEGGNGHYYQLVKDIVSWEDAKSLAEVVGGYLATITTSDEQNWIIQQFGKQPEGAWLGSKKEGNWKWITAETWDYANWGPNQPTSDIYLSMTLRDDSTLGYWYTIDALSNRWYIIEWGEISGKPVADIGGPYRGIVGKEISFDGSDSFYINGSDIPTGMVNVQAGSFQMGDTFAEGNADELPVHDVYTEDYFIDQYEVSNEEYAAFLNSAKADDLIEVTSNIVYRKNSIDPYIDLANYTEIYFSSDTFYVTAGREQYPVRYVSWFGADAFAKYYGLRLPTEAEWEKAAAWNPITSTKTRYAFGDTIDATLCNYDNQYSGATTPVGFFDGSNTGTVDSHSYYGCYDMNGNVWEWCNDWYASDYYSNSEAFNPQGPSNGTSRLVRGGSSYHVANDVRSTHRGYLPPVQALADGSFRCAVLAKDLASDNDGLSEYEWDFGDGTTGTGVNPVHQYSESGTYTVKLRVKDNNGVWSPWAENTIEILPIHQMVNGFDLNKDGYEDLVFGNDGPTYIYWGDENVFTSTNRTELSVEDAYTVRAADLNYDGWLDLVMSASFNSSQPTIYIYFGGQNGFSDHRRIDLPANQPIDISIGDLNADGYLDILVGNQNENTLIYWNSPDGFVSTNRLELLHDYVTANAIADLNNDAYPDIVLCEYDTNASYIYWGSASGYSESNQDIIETNTPYTCSPVDVDVDGYLDLVISQQQLGYSYVYKGSASGFSSANRISLPTTLCVGNAVSDLNQDGYKDIIFGSHGDGVTADIYWGSSSGYSETNKLGLEAIRTMKVGINDFDKDGYEDVVISNYNGSESYIYFGSSSATYSTSNRMALPTMSGIGLCVGSQRTLGKNFILSEQGDYDNDGIPNTYETSNGLNPLIDDSNLDLDNDGLSNADEYANNTNPQQVDSDNDGFKDGFETAHGSDPLDNTDTPQIDINTTSDLNADGHEDIVMSNYYDGSNYSINSYIYWGSTTGYSVTNKTELPTHGAQGNTVADLDGDGYLDIIFCNRLSGTTSSFTYDNNSYIYWGSESGYSSSNITELPTHGAFGASVADFNSDGHLDIVFSNYHTGTQHNSNWELNSYVYWGSDTGFDASNKTELPTLGAMGNAVGDLNQDGYVDIVFSHYRNNSSYNINSYIYWGSDTGFDASNKAELPTSGAHDASIEDLDNDGYLDLVFSNSNNGSTHVVNSYIYWGSSTGYSASNRAELSTPASTSNTVMDLNSDGYSDIIFSLSPPYTDYGNSYIYWGSDTGYENSNVSNIVTRHASSCAATDLNGDGYVDIICANQYNESTFVLNSYIYWGSDTGYSPSDKLELPTFGATGVSAGQHTGYGQKFILSPYGDYDHDFLPNGWETDNGLNPLLNDADEDNDNDGLANLEEYTNGTQADNADSDNDGMSDGYEVDYMLDPLADDSINDDDNDGLDNITEFILMTNPRLSDTDGDGYDDGDEQFAGTDPTDPDSFLRITQFIIPLHVLEFPVPIICWNSVPGKVYRVWIQTDLIGPDFVILADDIPAQTEETICPDQGGGPNNVPHPVFDPNPRLYKISVKE